MIRTRTTDPARLVAAGVCALEALVLAGVAVYYLVQVGAGTDPTRVLTEAALIALTAVGLAVLARLWLGGSSWPGTPTVVWHLLLVPVLVPMLQAGQLLVGLGLLVAVVLSIGAVLAQRRSTPEPDEPPS